MGFPLALVSMTRATWVCGTRMELYYVCLSPQHEDDDDASDDGDAGAGDNGVDNV